MSKKKPNQKEAFEEIFNRINCDAGVIFIDTPEENRVIREVYREFRNQDVQFWSAPNGLYKIKSSVNPDDLRLHKFKLTERRISLSGDFDSRTGLSNTLSLIAEDCHNKIKEDDSDPDGQTIYILRDADKFFNNPILIRQLRDMIYLCSVASSTIIITGFGVEIPNDLTKECPLIKLRYPTKQEIIDDQVSLLRAKIAYNNKVCDNKIDDNFDDLAIAGAAVGLTSDQIVNVLQYTAKTDRCLSIERILEEKRQIINKSDILEYWVCNTDMNSVGGFSEMKKWCRYRKINMVSPFAKEFGAPTPRGIMLVGVQGSGKTHIAKSLAQDWNVGLIKLDMGKVFAGLVGESEKRMRQALAQVEAAGGVVVVDEIDKGLSGAGSSDKTDGGTTSRVIGTLLTWLAEEHPGVFLVCTANDISGLLRNHPELLRKGRIDEVWFSDLPTEEEREEIFKIHLLKRGRDVTKFDIKKLAAYSFKENGKEFNLTGAEIEYAITDALIEKFAQSGGNREVKIGSKDDINTDDILNALKIIKPIHKMAEEPINKMRKWAADNARNVSTKLPEVKEKKNGTHRLNLRDLASEISETEI